MALADRQILLNQRLRASTDAAVRRIWGSLPNYDRPSVDQWLSQVLPVILAAQRQEVALTEAYLTAALDRPVQGVDPAELIGKAARGGTDPEEVYTRPFIHVWQGLSQGRPYVEAVNVGLARATSAAATDVQLAMRDTLKAVGEIDPAIAGYQRVADPGACEYCLLLDGAQFRTEDPMPIHNFCGCGVEPVVYTRGFANRNNLAKFNADKASIPDGVKVNDHGELGPILGDPDQHFTKL